MTGAVSKADLFARLGYGGSYELLEEVLEDAGLSRPDKENMSPIRKRLFEKRSPTDSCWSVHAAIARPKWRRWPMVGSPSPPPRRRNAPSAVAQRTRGR